MESADSRVKDLKKKSKAKKLRLEGCKVEERGKEPVRQGFLEGLQKSASVES